MTRSEKVTILTKAQQLFTYDEWFQQIGYIYGFMNMHNSPAEEYAEYVEEKLEEYFGSNN